MMDLIPADIVAALVIAAGAYAAAAHCTPAAATVASTKVYHAASAQSHPITLQYICDGVAKFWTDNPPPFVLPFTK
jgi:hypothetical protein